MKRYVMPTIKVLIVLAISVALVKFAFFPSNQDASSADITPGFSQRTQVTQVTKGDIANSIDVSGQIVEDTPVDAKATAGGTIDSLSVAEGTDVNEGEPIAVIKTVEKQAATPDSQEGQGDQQGEGEGDSQGGSDSSDNSSGSDSSGGGAPATTEKVTWNTVYAPVTGTVKYQVIANQEVTVGTVVAAVSPTTYSATGTMTPAQQYRLSSTPAEATVTVNGGPAPFTCTNLSIGTKKTTSADPGSPGGPAGNKDGSSVEVRCSVPPEQQVFPGLTATIGIDGGAAQGTLMVPVSAVEGSIGTGYVWVVKDPKNPTNATRTEVTLGLTDGTSIQITGGVEEGTQILQYAPGSTPTAESTPTKDNQEISVG